MEDDISRRATKARGKIQALSTPLQKEKATRQVTQLEEFAEVVPGLGNVTKFLTSPRVDGFFEKVLKKGGGHE